MLLSKPTSLSSSRNTYTFPILFVMAAMMSERMSDPTPPLSMDRSLPPPLPAAACSSSSPAGTPDPSPSILRQLDSQNQSALRSKEYRQLFGLPEDEVHIQDFNCALQDNMLLQGHMYLFSNFICFYANFLSFETKKVIPIHEITCVKRAKVAGIFPTAIEIATDEKKFFFASFLSREEAFKLINDGWSKTCNRVKSITDHLEVQPGEKNEESFQENGRDVVEDAESICRPSTDESDLSERNIGGHKCEELVLPAEADPGAPPLAAGLQDTMAGDVEVVQNLVLTSSSKSPAWEEEDCDAPEVPAGFMMVAESKFPIKVEEFFQFFFSDEAVTFQDSFHKKCGDKDFRCTEWCYGEKCGFTRDVSFQHPIKIYLGAKFGGCQEAQKYRVHRNCHLVVETSQGISDVPYGDYFRVEGLWHVKRDVEESKTGCIVKVYTNVNFSKGTMFKGKIIQSTVDECRDVFAIWMNLAHELLKQNKIEKACIMVQNDQVPHQKEVGTATCLEKSTEVNRVQTLPSLTSGSENVADAPSGTDRGSSFGTTLFGDCLAKFRSAMQVQSPVSLILVLGIALILLLMQISILTLLSRPQQIQVIPQADWMNGNGMNSGTLGEKGSEVALLDRKIKNLKEEMQIFESLLERMRHEHASLKSRLTDLELLQKRQK